MTTTFDRAKEQIDAANEEQLRVIAQTSTADLADLLGRAQFLCKYADVFIDRADADRLRKYAHATNVFLHGFDEWLLAAKSCRR